jgi:hypothetical protein
MSYTVTLCDASFADVTTPAIHLEATTPGGTVLCSLTNGPIARGYGGTLTFTPTRQRFNVEINTSGTRYAPLVLEDLNGDRHPQTIDVLLLMMPTGSSGKRPSTSAQLQSFIGGQSWSSEEKGAVYQTISTLSYLKRQTSDRVKHMRQSTEALLEAVGIGPDLVLV